MVNNVYDVLVAASLAGGAAVILALLLRRILRHAFGAAIAYQSWLIVPVAALVAALPTAPIARPAMLSSLPTLPLATVAAPVAKAGAFNWTPWVLLAWCAGALVFAVWTWRAHRRFLRKVDDAVERNGVLYAASPQTGPALVGIWRPRIVVPADFAVRFTPPEQDLILAHERMHAARGDTAANLACAAMQCLFWFNPLVHVAARYVRFDQELACDAAVMQSKPALQRSYAAAMLKAQMSEAGSSISCHWQSHHPLKERIMQLQATRPPRARRLAGRLLLTAMVAIAAGATLAARANSAPSAPAQSVFYDVKMTIQAGTHFVSPRMFTRPGARFALRVGEPGAQLEGEFVLTTAGSESVKLDTVLRHAGKTLGQPSMLMRLGEAASVKVGPGAGNPGFQMEVVVTKAAQLDPAK